MCILWGLTIKIINLTSHLKYTEDDICPAYMLFSFRLRSLKGKFPFPSTPGQVHNSSWITPGSNSSPGADVSICQSLFGEFQSASTSIVNFTFKWVSVLCGVQAFPLKIKSVSSVSVLD